jgi:hypothetical protein
MASIERAAFPRIVSLLLLVSLAAAKPAFADDLTGALHDDPKDLLPPPAQEAASAPLYDTGFLPLPPWARGVVMPPLPATLRPMGGKVAVLTTPPVPAPPPLAPPKDSEPSTVIVAKPTPVTPAPAPASNPALIAVSPFLEWIKANPQAAAEQARQQAGAYQAPGDASAPAAGANPASPAGAASAAPPPYWMPPLIDSAPFGTGNTTGSSAAIYSTPQR